MLGLKLLVLAAVLAVAWTDGLDSFAGRWTGVKVFFKARHPLSQECLTLNIGTTNKHCKCGSDNNVPVAIFKEPHYELENPVVIIEEEEELEDALKLTCKCLKTEKPFWIFHRLSDNYLVLNYALAGPDFRVLLAKTIPTEKELDDFVASVKELKDEPGLTMCTSDGVNSSGGKQKTATATAGVDNEDNKWFKVIRN